MKTHRIEILRFPHFLDNQLMDGSEAVDLMRGLHLCLTKYLYGPQLGKRLYSIFGDASNDQHQEYPFHHKKWDTNSMR
jgi:hypothetical protein